MEIKLHGAKNSALPIIAATLLKKTIYYIKNINMYDDILTQLELLKQFNINLYTENNKLIINTENMKIPNKIIYNDNMRGSYYFIGSTITYSNLTYELGNGCDIDINNRKINYHIDLIELTGKKIILNDNKITLHGDIIDREIEYEFQNPSVGGTINGLFIFSKFKSKIILKNYAKDPYIYDVISFLKCMKKNIYYDDYKIIMYDNHDNYEIKLIKFNICYDPIEILTYIIFSAMNLSENMISSYNIGPININHLGKSLDLLHTIGIELIKHKKNFYLIKKNKLNNFKIQTGYFPDIYTDIQPFLCILALFINGQSIIEENIWKNRIKYVNEIIKFGYDIELYNNKIIINNDKYKYDNKYINEIILTDLRGGMALYLLLKLKYKNLDNIKIINKKYIDRGYIDYDYNIDLIMNSKNIHIDYNTNILSNLNIGGKTKYFIEIENINEMKNILIFCKKNQIKYKLIGDGTNIYFDYYFDGLVIKNNIKYINYKDTKEYHIVKIGSGNKLTDLVEIALTKSINIMELSGIPGTIGGSIYNNAGAYGLEIKDILYKCEILDKNLKRHIFSNNDIKFDYRKSIFKFENFLIVNTVFKIKKEILSNDYLYKKHKDILNIRINKFQSKNTLGSIFKNIILNNDKIYVWKILDELNYRGKIINNIKFSDINPNIMLNVSPNYDLNMIDKFTNLIKDIIYETKIKYNIYIETEIEFIKN